MSGTLLGGSFHVDNVEIAYTTPLSGGATAFSASTASSSITVAAVNDAPAGANNTVTTLEDTAYVFAAADFGFTDADDNREHLLAVTDHDAAGRGHADAQRRRGHRGQVGHRRRTSLRACWLHPGGDANGAGYASFTFQVQDDGGTANGGIDLDPTPTR